MTSLSSSQPLPSANWTVLVRPAFGFVLSNALLLAVMLTLTAA
jgi:hypothetical protein